MKNQLITLRFNYRINYAILLIMMTCTIGGISQEKLEVDGKVKITEMAPSESDSVVVWNSDGTLARRDASTLSELQVLSISNDTIFLSGGEFVKLPAEVDGDVTNEKITALAVVGDSLAITEGGMTMKVAVDSSNTNEKITGFGIIGDSLYIKEGSMDTMKVGIANKSYVDLLEKRIADLEFGLDYSLGKDSISDIDGNYYKIVKIGTQYWMAENLRTTRYRDGSAIDSANSNTRWTTDLTNGKWCWYNRDSMTYEVPYGKLYNWYAVNDSRGLCPTGWHVPSDDVAGGDSEWQILIDFLINNGYGYEGSGTDIGKSMAATFGWESNGTPGNVGNDQGSNNTSGFSGLPGGIRSGHGTFYDVGNFGFWWSSSQFNTGNAWYRYLSYDYGNVNRNGNIKELGFSVRCLRD